MKLEIVERYPTPNDEEGVVGRPSRIKIHAENSEEALVVEMISNSMFELNGYRRQDEGRNKSYPADDSAEITMSEFGRKTPGTIHLSISNFHPHNRVLWADTTGIL